MTEVERMHSLLTDGAAFNRHYRTHKKDGWRVVEDTGIRSIALPNGCIIEYKDGATSGALVLAEALCCG